MEPIYIVIIILLGILAVVDLMVGVSNDAINFLNSALGSRVAPVRTILTVAACGIMVGVVTSHGMMEVARTGVMYPSQFTFREIMLLYAAVMLTDVVLLNTFNRLGLPTSTTVSMIFELLGAAVAVSLFKIYASGAGVGSIETMVNGGKALTMISAILVSVALSFVVGMTVMWISRLLFTFRYKPLFKRYGALWCGVAIVGILYFAIIKGLKSSGLITDDINAYIEQHTLLILVGTWMLAAIVLRLLQQVNVNILKITILSGTFALALAFAGNDLVNFVGVPLAGLDAYQLALDSGDTTMLMGDLAHAQPATIWFLIAAGVVMVITLFFSRDAMRVSQTELTLASQHDEAERFSSSAVSRALVRSSLSLSNRYRRLLPLSWQDSINRRFVPLSREEREGSNYDQIRAVVNLACAAILICIGTSFKLPLSTTYVVFMVSMGSSLADRAWGRESAVYRITGVMVVIMGWFVTALVAFTAALGVSSLLQWGGGYALAFLIVVAGAMLCSRFFGSKSTENVDEDSLNIVSGDETPQEVMHRCTSTVIDTVQQVSQVYNHTLVALYSENRAVLKENVKTSEQMYQQAQERKDNIVATLKVLQRQGIETGHYYVQVTDYLCEVTKALLHCTHPALEHINNNHRGLSGEQIHALKHINDLVDKVFGRIQQMLTDDDFTHLDDVMSMRDNLFDEVAMTIKQEIKRLQGNDSGSSRASLLFLSLLNETKLMVLQARNLIKAQAYFLEKTTLNKS